MMDDAYRTAFRWLVAAFAAACATLVLQTYPTLGLSALYAMDVRNWSWTAFWIVNGVVLASLIGYRAWVNR